MTGADPLGIRPFEESDEADVIALRAEVLACSAPHDDPARVMRMHRNGHGSFVSATGVWVTDAVPAAYLSRT
jgi:hypothetical protein